MNVDPERGAISPSGMALAALHQLAERVGT